MSQRRIPKDNRIGYQKLRDGQNIRVFSKQPSENVLIMSNRPIRPAAWALDCAFCGKDFNEWSSDKRDLFNIAERAGWRKSNSGNWKCDECDKLIHP